MADVREIKSRINGVQDTEKITRAMYMIASSKMRKAKMELDNTRPYFDSLSAEIERVFINQEKDGNIYLRPESPDYEIPGCYAYLVITSDKGMAGFYNHGILKKMEEMINKHESKVYMIGELGRKYCELHNIYTEDDFPFSAENPTLRKARIIAQRLLEDYRSGEVSKIVVIYTDMKNGVYQQAIDFCLLPFFEGELEGTESDTKFDFFPSVEKVFDNMIESYMSGYIYGALVDSYCCELSARMTAMDEANRNADEILGELHLQYNHARQGKITQEITEISSGARALKRKKAQALKKKCNG